MSSAVSCIVIKSDRLPGRVPEIGQIVRLRGRSGLFTVVNVDKSRRVAQLMEKAGLHHLMDASFADIRTINRSLANTIRRFLDSAGRSRELRSDTTRECI